jgi:hypothetical protein
MVTRRLRVLMAEKRLSEVGLILRSICAEGGWTLEMIFVETREEVGAALRRIVPIWRCWTCRCSSLKRRCMYMYYIWKIVRFH